MADYVSQSTLRLLAVGLVCIAAIAMGAATITSTVDVGTPDGDSTDRTEINSDNRINETADDDDNGGGFDRSGEGQSTEYNFQIERCNEFLASMPGTILYFGAIVGFLYLLKRRYSTGSALVGSYAIAPIVLTAYFLNTSCGSDEGGALGDGGASGLGDSSSQFISTPEISPLVLVAVFGALLVAAAAVMVRASGDQTIEPDEEDDLTDDPDVSDLAAAAGAAADRLEKHNADVDNAVYRAWWEMTRLLEVPNPDSATPGEFAQAAIDLGMSDAHVDELTRLFEEVRYGKRDPESREQLAIDVFREIEDEYGGSGASLEAAADAVDDEEVNDDGY